MKKIAGNIFSLLVVIGIIIYFAQEVRKSRQKTKLTKT